MNCFTSWCLYKPANPIIINRNIASSLTNLLTLKFVLWSAMFPYADQLLFLMCCSFWFSQLFFWITIACWHLHCMKWAVQSKNSLVFQCAVVEDFVISEIYVGPKVLFPTDIKKHFCDSITSSQCLRDGEGRALVKSEHNINTRWKQGQSNVKPVKSEFEESRWNLNSPPLSMSQTLKHTHKQSSNLDSTRSLFITWIRTP